MKVLRVTMFPPPGSGEPMHIVTRQEDMNIPVEEAATPDDTPGVFYVSDIFEVADGTGIQEATLEAGRRADDQEPNMAVHYYWTAMYLKRTVPGGVIGNTERSPLTVEQLKVCMKQLADHPAYEGHIVMSWAKDGTGVRLKSDGNVAVGGSL